MYLWRKEKDRAQRAESPALFALCTEKPGQGQSAAYLEQVSTTVPKSAILRFLSLAGNLLGSAFPKPCFAACAAYPRRAHAARKEVTTMRKKYNTPHRSRVVKTRLSEDEYADFTARLAPYGISQSEFLRQAIRRTAIRPIIHVSAVNDELLSAVGKLTAEYGRIGGNLNQIARYLNEYGVPYNALSGEVRAAIADLAALKYEVLKKVGDAVGNTQAYQL